MAKFKDSVGRDWVLALDVHTIGLVDAKTSVRVDRLFDNELAILTDLAKDPVKLVGVLWVIVEEQAAKPGITPEQFGRGLAGDSLEDALDALVEAVTDFSPRRQRKLLRALTAKSTEVAEAQTTLGLTQIAAIDPWKPVTRSEPATNSPAWSESIPPG